MATYRFDAKGFKPTFGTYAEISRMFRYWRAHLGPCSMRRMSHKEVLKGAYEK